MTTKQPPSFILLFLLISFGSISAVLFTPALPEIGHFFAVSENLTRLTMTIFLVGYAVGQLIYGPLANGYGRKPAIYTGIFLEILGSLLCVFAGTLSSFTLLVIARFFMAIGASVGLNMTFTLVADCYDTAKAKKLISYLMMAFAITPGLGVTLGGYLAEHAGWQSCFYASAAYGVALFFLLIRTAETAPSIDKKALKLNNILSRYWEALLNVRLVSGSFLIGCGTSFVYSFAAVAPFLTMQVMHLSPSQYGLWNLVPAVGIFLGSHLSALFAHRLRAIQGTGVGLTVIVLGTLCIVTAFLLHFANPYTLFIPMAIIYIGMSFIFSNTSSLVLQSAHDKSSTSAMMSFLNMGTATVSVFMIGLVNNPSSFLLPISYSVFALIGLLLFSVLRLTSTKP